MTRPSTIVLSLTVALLWAGAAGPASAQSASSATYQIHQQTVGDGGSSVDATNETADSASFHSFHTVRTEIRGEWNASASFDGRQGFIAQFGCPPAAPTGIAQLRADGVTPVSTGGVTSGTTLIVQATLTAQDPLCDLVRLAVEVRALGTAFTGNATHVGAFVGSGSGGSITLTGLAAGSFHWQYRSQITHGALSSWTSFGANAETDADFRVDMSPPSAPGTPSLTSGASPNSSGTFTIGWTAATDDTGISDYEVQRSLNGGVFATVALTGGALSHSETGLPAGTYTYQIRAVDLAGNFGSFSSVSSGVVVDTSAPAAGSVSDGTGADADFQAGTTSLSANWTAFTDAESGIAGYEWAIGTTPGGTETQAFTSVGLVTSASNTALTLSTGATYYASVRATNGAGLTTTATSDGLLVDATAPPAGTVSEGSGADIDFTGSATTIQANWSGFADLQSGIAGYEWAIGTTAGGSDVQSFTAVGLLTSVSNAGLTLTHGTRYFVTVRATNNSGLTVTATGDGVTSVTTPPNVISISPTQGPQGGGTAVTITGAEFLGSFLDGTLIATINGQSLVNPLLASATQITGLAPNFGGTTGALTVSVQSLAGTNSLPGGYTSVGAPALTGIIPAIGSTAGGTAVTISGSGFVAGAGVTFGGSALVGLTVVDGNTITGTTPTGARGNAPVTITTSGGSASLATGFRYVGSPQVTGISPSAASTGAGGSITLFGIDLDGSDVGTSTTATIGGSALTGLTVVDANTITGTKPAGSEGIVDVVVTTTEGTSTLADAFTYLASPPTISSISPSTGSTAGGTTFTIAGTGLTTGTSVTIGGAAVSGLAFASATSMTGLTPAGSVGAQDVVVTNAAGTATLTGGFTYTVSAPTLSGVSPASGSAGGSIVIFGSAFVAGTTVTIGGTPLVGLAIQSQGTITGTIPAGAGTVDVVVTNANGTSMLTGGFTYAAAPSATILASAATGEAPFSVTLSVSSSNLGTIANIAWDIDADDGLVDGDEVFDVEGTSATSIIRTYGLPGSYTVLVVVTDLAGNTASAAVTITVTDPPAPATTITADAATGAVPLTVTYTVASPSASAVAYQWDFDGDGEFDAQTTGAPPASTVSTTFLSPGGPFDGTLRIVLADGTTQIVDLPDVTVTPFAGIGTTSAQVIRLYQDLDQDGEYDAGPPDESIDFAAVPVVGIGSQTREVGQVLGFQAETFPDAGLPAGMVVSRWEWDVNGDGEYDTGSAVEPSGASALTATQTEMSRLFGTAGTFSVRVRCTYALAGVEQFNVEDTVAVTVTAAAVADRKVFIVQPKSPVSQGNGVKAPARIAGNSVDFNVNAVPASQYDFSTVLLQVWRSGGWETLPGGTVTNAGSAPPAARMRVNVDSLITGGFLTADQTYPFRARATASDGTIVASAADTDPNTTAPSGSFQGPMHYQVRLSSAGGGKDVVTSRNSPGTTDALVTTDSDLTAMVGAEVEVQIALGGITSAATLSEAGLASNPTAVSGPSTGVSYGSVNLSAGALAAPAVVRLYYADTDSDGTVDGTSVSETSVRIFRFNTSTGAWMPLADQTVNPSENWVEGVTHSFSDFGVGGTSTGSSVATPSSPTSTSTAEAAVPFDPGDSGGGGCFIPSSVGFPLSVGALIMLLGVLALSPNKSLARA